VLGPAVGATATFSGREVDVEAELGCDDDLIADGPKVRCVIFFKSP
jgi:hypothetical protein